MFFFKRLDAFVDTQARGHRERTEIILHTRITRRDEIREAEIRIASRLFILLAQAVPGHDDGLAPFVGIEFDIVTAAVGRINRKHTVGLQPAAFDDFLQHRLRIGKHLLRFNTNDCVFKDLRIGTREIPGLEERRPVDTLGDLGEIVVLQMFDAHKSRRRRHVCFPVGLEGIGARRRQRN